MCFACISLAEYGSHLWIVAWLLEWWKEKIGSQNMEAKICKHNTQFMILWQCFIATVHNVIKYEEIRWWCSGLQHGWGTWKRKRAEGKGRPWTVARRRGPGYLLMCSMFFVALRRTAWHEVGAKLWQKLRLTCSRVEKAPKSLQTPWLGYQSVNYGPRKFHSSHKQLRRTSNRRWNLDWPILPSTTISWSTQQHMLNKSMVTQTLPHIYQTKTLLTCFLTMQEETQNRGSKWHQLVQTLEQPPSPRCCQGARCFTDAAISPDQVTKWHQPTNQQDWEYYSSTPITPTRD